jgi:CBS domain-containing protein
VDTVDPEISVNELVEQHVMGSDQRAFPVLDRGRFVGLVCLQDVRKVPRESWPGTRVRDIMTPAGSVSTLGPRDDAAEAMFTLTRRGVNQLPVIDDGKVIGVLQREDILRWLSLYGDSALGSGSS